jgi:hypothetical protein
MYLRPPTSVIVNRASFEITQLRKKLLDVLARDAKVQIGDEELAEDLSPPVFN